MIIRHTGTRCGVRMNVLNRRKKPSLEIKLYKTKQL